MASWEQSLLAHQLGEEPSSCRSRWLGCVPNESASRMASGSPLEKRYGMRRLVLTSLGHVEPEVLGALVPRPEEHDLGGDRLAGHLGLDVKKVLLACHLCFK